jgi:hypothetical protein
MKREVSDKVIFILLFVAVVVSVLGGYTVYEYSNSYSLDNSERVVEDHATGHVTLVVVEKESNEKENIDESVK